MENCSGLLEDILFLPGGQPRNPDLILIHEASFPIYKLFITNDGKVLILGNLKISEKSQVDDRLKGLIIVHVLNNFFLPLFS